MSDHNGSGDLDRRTAERVLDGAAEHARLHALLAAASAPARPGELAGEDTAVVAFKAARLPARTSRMAALRRFLTVKALVLVGGSLILTGGGAYAAMNGHIPGRDPAPSSTPTLDEKTGKGRHSHPVGQVTPPSEEPATAPPSAPPATTKRRSGPSGAPGAPGIPAAPSEGSGRERVPDRQQNPAPPVLPSPPRGPGEDSGSQPGKKPGNGQNDGKNGGSPGQNSGGAAGVAGADGAAA